MADERESFDEDESRELTMFKRDRDLEAAGAGRYSHDGASDGESDDGGRVGRRPNEK